MNRLFVWILLLPRFLWRAFGADPDHLEAILKVKLLNEARRPFTMGGMGSKKSIKGFRALIQFFVSLFMGIIYMLPLLILENLSLAMTFFYTLFGAILSFLLITDFSSVLFDNRDRYILYVRPVKDQTVFISRALFIFVYLFQLVFPMAIPAWILMIALHGTGFAVYFFLPLLLLIFIVLFTVLGIYLLLLKWAGPGRFRDWISYFQIAWTMIIIITGYFLPLVLDQEFFLNPDPAQFQWLSYLPTYWLAMTWVPLGVDAFLPGTAWLGLLSLGAVLVIGTLALRPMTRRFVRKMNEMDTEQGKRSPQTKAPSNRRFAERVADFFHRRPEARAGFQLTWIQTGRSRTFRMKVFPMFGYVPVLFVYIIYSANKDNFAQAIQGLSTGKSYLTLLYISGLTVMQAVNYLIYSEHYKASWVYRLSPTQRPGYILAGAFTALWIKYFSLFYLLISIVLVWIWGWPILFDIGLALVNLLVYNLVVLLFANRALPFSQIEQLKESGGRVFKSLATLLVPGVLVLIHWLSFDMIWLKILFTVLSGIALWMLWDSLIRLPWSALEPRPSKKNIH